MVPKNKLKDGLEERLRERIKKLKLRKARYAFLSDLTLPTRMKQRNQEEIAKCLEVLKLNLPNIKKLLKLLRKYFINIWDQTNTVAVYLLLGKAINDLEVLILLTEQGYSLELTDIARSGQESIDLAFLFTEEGQEKRLAEWFKGKTIKNEKARKLLHKVINKFNKQVTGSNNRTLPVKEAKSDIYGIYSLFTHSCYPALLDLIDVFHEDFDFDRYSGFHYSKEYLHLVHNLAINILLEFKNVFSKIGNNEGFLNADNLLKKIGYENATHKEIREIFSRYG